MMHVYHRYTRIEQNSLPVQTRGEIHVSASYQILGRQCDVVIDFVGRLQGRRMQTFPLTFGRADSYALAEGE